MKHIIVVILMVQTVANNLQEKDNASTVQHKSTNATLVIQSSGFEMNNQAITEQNGTWKTSPQEKMPVELKNATAQGDHPAHTIPSQSVSDYNTTTTEEPEDGDRGGPPVPISGNAIKTLAGHGRA